MRCLFCKEASDTSKSVEHIIPEAIGNTRHILDRGVVCDRCNNYFSRKVEGPLLSHRSMRNIRAWHLVPNKKGRYPSLVGFVAGTDIDIALGIEPDGSVNIRPERGSDKAKWEKLVHHGSKFQSPRFIFPMDLDPPKREMSRFLAKMALEALYFQYPSLADFLIDDPHYDMIRSYARIGNQNYEWPYHQRRIFPVKTLMRHPETNEWVQAGFGYDFFLTKRRETYYAFCLYGIEFVINVGGPSIKGYLKWLEDHNQISPLIERTGAKLIRKCFKSYVD